MKFQGRAEEYFELKVLRQSDCHVLIENIEESLSILWFQGAKNELIVDGKSYTFFKNQIVFLTEFHQVFVKKIDPIRFIRFNRPFYCVIDHDKEIGCKGVLFFGASQLPIIELPDEDLMQFETLWDMYVIEMKSNDHLQIDMLQIMLKRYLILCTRLFKMQQKYPDQKIGSDIIKEFNFLVEQHFRTKHTVIEYGELLNKSPKTLSNIFSKFGSKTPLQYIQERKMLEARRRLSYTDMQIQEIAYEIGFEDVQSFSRFFKNKEGIAPSVFRKISQGE